MYAHQILDALHTAQITKLPRPTDKLCFQCGGTLYQFDDRLQCVAPGCGSYQYLEREHKIGEDGE